MNTPAGDAGPVVGAGAHQARRGKGGVELTGNRETPRASRISGSSTGICSSAHDRYGARGRGRCGGVRAACSVAAEPADPARNQGAGSVPDAARSGRRGGGARTFARRAGRFVWGRIGGGVGALAANSLRGVPHVCLNAPKISDRRIHRGGRGQSGGSGSDQYGGRGTDICSPRGCRGRRAACHPDRHHDRPRSSAAVRSCRAAGRPGRSNAWRRGRRVFQRFAPAAAIVRRGAWFAALGWS